MVVAPLPAAGPGTGPSGGPSTAPLAPGAPSGEPSTAPLAPGAPVRFAVERVLFFDAATGERAA